MKGMADARRGRQQGTRKYPRALRVNELLREVLADELELLEDGDDRLGLLTITAVESEPDLRTARVLFSSLPEGAEEALVEHRARLQAAIGRQARLKRTPQLSFAVDHGVQHGQRIEDVLRDLNRGTGG